MVNDAKGRYVDFTKGCFKFKNKKYYSGTMVRFNREWLEANGHPLYKDTYDYRDYFSKPFVHYGECIYGKFYSNFKSQGCCFGRFKNPDFRTSLDDDYFGFCFYLDPSELEAAIEEILDPVEVVDNPSKKWNEIPECKMLLVVYIILMLASLILTEPWGCWIGFTVLYIGINQRIIDHESGNDHKWN